MTSADLKEWVKAMDDEILPVNNSNTFTLTVRGKWVYSIKGILREIRSTKQGSWPSVIARGRRLTMERLFLPQPI